MPSTDEEGLLEAIIEIREDEALEIVDSLLEGGTDPATVIETCREAMAVIGRRFESGEAFIPELIMAGEIMSRISATVKPHLRAGDPAAAGRGCVVLGTVKGDIHDIGKDIVGSLLEASGFQVVDLGVDVPATSVVAAVGEHGRCIVALSCLLTTGFDSMKATMRRSTKPASAIRRGSWSAGRPSPHRCATTRARMAGVPTPRRLSVLPTSGPRGW